MTTLKAKLSESPISVWTTPFSARPSSGSCYSNWVLIRSHFLKPSGCTNLWRLDLLPILPTQGTPAPESILRPPGQKEPRENITLFSGSYHPISHCRVILALTLLPSLHSLKLFLVSACNRLALCLKTIPSAALGPSMSQHHWALLNSCSEEGTFRELYWDRNRHWANLVPLSRILDLNGNHRKEMLSISVCLVTLRMVLIIQQDLPFLHVFSDSALLASSHSACGSHWWIG